MAKVFVIVPAPVTPVEKLVVEFRQYLHLPDPAPLQILTGAVAANMIDGPSVNLMLIGPPSCGKTELLNSTLDIDHMVEGGDIASEAAFLSGSPAKDKVRDATGGLLRQTGDHGGLILNEFNSILSRPRDKIASIMAVFREVYSGRWTRHIGSEGGRSLDWTGRLGVFAGCTGRIDQEHQVLAEMGERWIYYRYKWKETFPETQKALSNERGEWRKALREYVRQFYLNLGIQFGLTAPRRDFTNREQLQIHKLATVTASCRSSVARDYYTKEIIGTKETELSVRLAGALAQLYVGMEFIGVSERERWRLLHKVAMDSMPHVRKQVIEGVVSGPTTLEKLQEAIGCSLGVIKRTVEDLQIHGVLRNENGIVRFSEWMEQNYPANKLR